jgi:hypothetical protein
LQGPVWACSAPLLRHDQRGRGERCPLRLCLSTRRVGASSRRRRDTRRRVGELGHCVESSPASGRGHSARILTPVLSNSFSSPTIRSISASAPTMARSVRSANRKRPSCSRPCAALRLTDVLDLVLDPSSQLLGLFLDGVEEPHGSSSLYALRSHDSDGGPAQTAAALATSLLLDFERAGRRLTTEAAREGWSACHSTGSSALVASRASASAPCHYIVAC